MLRIWTVILLMAATILAADEPSTAKPAAPAGWGGETIQLAPEVAHEMKLKGSEHIRFAPEVMNPESDTFFSYAFVFELEPMECRDLETAPQDSQRLFEEVIYC